MRCEHLYYKKKNVSMKLSMNGNGVGHFYAAYEACHSAKQCHLENENETTALWAPQWQSE